MGGGEPTVEEHVRTVGAHFEIAGVLRRVAKLEAGHINDSFVVEYVSAAGPARFVHQRINERVFPDPEAVALNVARVTRHLHVRLASEHALDAARRALTLVPARDGRPFHRDATGCWYTYVYVEGAHVLETARTPADALEAGRGFGEFVRLVDDLDEPLAQTIPAFHDRSARRAALDAAVTADPVGRVRQASVEIGGVSRLHDVLEAAALRREIDRLPVRVAHHDAKLDNLLVDDATGRALCVIDLDTVMRGRVTSDFGELVRTAVSAAPEDEPNPGRVRVDPARFAAVARGFLAEAGGCLAPEERRGLGIAGPLLALMNATRFLTDYLVGDTYYRTVRPHQNLQRCRTQLALARDLAEHLDALDDMVAEAARATGVADHSSPR